MNEAIFNLMITTYNHFSFTHDYIFGFEYKGTIYMTKATSEILPFVLCLDRASRGAGYALRFKPNNSQKLLLLANAKAICSKEFFEAKVNESIYNAGEIFEKLVTERFGQVWTKDNIPFTKAGDLQVGRIAYQIKFQKATFINEKQIERLRANRSPDFFRPGAPSSCTKKTNKICAVCQLTFVASCDILVSSKGRKTYQTRGVIRSLSADPQSAPSSKA